MINVCIITSWFPNRERPALAPFVYNLVQSLVRNGINVTVITNMAKGEKSLQVESGLHIYRIDGRFPLFSIYRILKKIRPDIINVHAPNFFSSSSVIVSKLIKIPIFATVYRGEVSSVSKPLSLLRKFVLRRFERVVVCSKFTRDLTADAGVDPSRISVIHNASNESIFFRFDKSSARLKLGIGIQKKVILYVGNLIKLKGVYTLIESLKIVNEKCPDFVAILVGHGSEREQLEALAEKYGIEHNIRFVGWIPQSELAMYLNATDVFVLPSTVEGQSVAVLEAMTCGCPVVASRIPGNEESIRDTIDGLLFTPGDQNDLAEKLLNLLGDKEKAESFSENASRSYHEKFSEETQVRKYLKLYGSILKSGVEDFESSEDTSSRCVLLFDNQGLSHYTSYLAYGLSKYLRVALYGFSETEYEITGAASTKRVDFVNISKSRIFNSRTSLFTLSAKPLIIFLLLLKAINSRRSCNLIHIQGHLPMFFLVVPFLRLQKKRIFWTLHDIRLRPSTRGLRGKLELLYVRATTQPSFLSKHVDIVFVHGNCLKERLISMGVRSDKISVIPHFDYNYLLRYRKNSNYGEKPSHQSDDSDLERIINEGEDIAYALLFGRIAPYKGIDILIQASRIANQKLNSEEKFRLVIAGRGDISFFRHNLREEDKKVIHVINRYITHYEIPALIGRARFVVLPYVDASQSGVLSLSYTFSKPVIVSNSGSLSEFVEAGRTGFVFKSEDVNELADYIVELIRDESGCKAMGERARHKLNEEMSLERCCRQINELYKLD